MTKGIEEFDSKETAAALSVIADQTTGKLHKLVWRAIELLQRTETLESENCEVYLLHNEEYHGKVTGVTTKLEAIKLVRNCINVSLAASKSMVESGDVLLYAGPKIDADRLYHTLTGAHPKLDFKVKLS